MIWVDLFVLTSRIWAVLRRSLRSRFFFRVSFLFVFWKVLEGSFGARMAHFGSILRSFGSHFCDFLGIRWISENVCFTMVKH